jgi:hypothetical protein
MEDFTLANVGASFKKWGCCTPTLPKRQAHPHNNKKKSNFFKINQKIWKKGGQSVVY